MPATVSKASLALVSSSTAEFKAFVSCLDDTLLASAIKVCNSGVRASGSARFNSAATSWSFFLCCCWCCRRSRAWGQRHAQPWWLLGFGSIQRWRWWRRKWTLLLATLSCMILHLSLAFPFALGVLWALVVGRPSTDHDPEQSNSISSKQTGAETFSSWGR